MHKSLLLTLALSLCVADSGAFAAPRANARGSVATSAGATQQNTTSVSARVASRQKVVNTAPVSTGKVVARSAAKKSALSMGTKVVTATENVAVSQECQNIYYGCMDAFCMLDNAAGGRCQCSDKNAELDVVLNEIMRVDEQSNRIATEGVEQIQMGEYANQVNSKAESIEGGIVSSESATVASSKKSSSSASRTLDLESIMNTNFFDVENDDDIFVYETENSIIDDINGKTGDKLQKAATKVCVAQVPAECKASLSILQMAYAQKVKSDCIGYENALKQQRTSSQQKLLMAQKAVRDAALDEVRKQNRYGTAGECAIAFAQCMQTTAECGSDYTGCVTLAAAENVRNNSAGSKAKQTTIKGVVSGADITLAASTMEQLLAKKEICASVTKQCVNSNKNDEVWDIFLRNAAPALKSAELVAEQNLRSSCIPTAAECFRNACKSQFGEDDESYDMCLSNPATYKSLCKVQLEPCLEATGGSYDNPEDSTLWNGLIAMLNSMKVDACTKEIKDCLLSKERCGKDFSGCIGLDTYSIGRICPVEKLTACVTNGRYAKRTINTEDGGNSTEAVENEDEIREYIVQIAQGLMLNIDNSFLTQCQNAANEAMIRVCGDTESCENVAFDLSTVESLMEVQACKWNDTTGENLTCVPDMAQFTDDEVYSLDYSSKTADAKLVRKKDENGNDIGSYGVYATLLNEPDVSSITFGGNSGDLLDNFIIEGDVSGNKATDRVVEILKGALDRTVGQIETDPKVTYCKTGREVQGFDKNKFGKSGEQSGRFPNLTDEYKYVIATSLLKKLSEKNMNLLEKFADQVDEMNNKITERVATIAEKRGDAVEEVVDAQNKTNCDQYTTGWGGDKHWPRRQAGSYDSNKNICTVMDQQGECINYTSGSFWRRSSCGGNIVVLSGREIKIITMPKFK